MSTPEIVSYDDKYLEQMFMLNSAAVPAVNDVSKSELKTLIENACHVILLVEFLHSEKEGRLVGFCICFDETALYESENYIWFKNNNKHFIYIDRIIINSAYHGKGLGSKIYDVLNKYAKVKKARLCCEVNLYPPNPGSLAFHKKIGFYPVGVQNTKNDSVTVCLLATE